MAANWIPCCLGRTSGQILAPKNVGVGLIHTVEVVPERVAEFLQVLEDQVAGLRPDCVRFDVLRYREESNKFVLFKAFADESASAIAGSKPQAKEWLDFAATGALVNEDFVNVETKSLPGEWAFQQNDSGDAPTSTILLVSVEVSLGISRASCEVL